MILLSLDSLTVRRGTGRVIDDVSLAVGSGEFVGLIGPNGAGKTTLVGMLCGRIAPTRGRVRFLDRDITDLPSHRRIAMGMAYTFQITSVFQRLDVLENIRLAARRRWQGAATVETAVGDVLARVGLEDEARKTAGELAYGHQRLLEIAMGIVQAPRLLIMDEPTQGLSDAEIARVVALVREISEEAMVLLIEHNMRVVMDVADQVTVLNFGRVLAEGTPEEIRANPEVQAAYLGSTDA